DEVLPIVYTTNFNSISEVFNSIEASVVNISMTVSTTNIWNQTYESTGSGSGIIYKIDGDDVYVATNNHVVDGATSVSVSITGEEQVFATLVGKDAENDLAVIKVSKEALVSAGVSEVKAAQFVSTDQAEIGETVLAIGNALGEGKTVTMGIISAKNKDISVDGNNLTVLQTDAAINPGNSGGALVNLDGQVIGINTAKTGSESIEGMGYAIPSYVAVSVIDQLIENGTVEKPYLGVVCFTITDNFRKMYNIDITGVFVQEVNSGSAAEKAGIRATDIITAVNGTTITSQADLQNIISGLSVGDSITIDFVRNGREAMSTTAVLENYNEF
ncbi:MAG: trypsin-like peptidase domain-containing protein, partial [Clostridiales bacterium]|nr:trypsin-like peptidase domain-containing protein [Clostridiales bacterium]